MSNDLYSMWMWEGGWCGVGGLWKEARFRLFCVICPPQLCLWPHHTHTHIRTYVSASPLEKKIHHFTCIYKKNNLCCTCLLTKKTKKTLFLHPPSTIHLICFVSLSLSVFLSLSLFLCLFLFVLSYFLSFILLGH